MALLVLYDGSCGLCHCTVRWLVRADRGATLRFAPLGGAAFRERVDGSARGDLPDSIVVADGSTLLVRSAAILRLLRHLGGGWAILGRIAGALPRGLLDLLYDGVARVRRRLFRRPNDACPLLPPELRARFLLDP